MPRSESVPGSFLKFSLKAITVQPEGLQVPAEPYHQGHIARRCVKWVRLRSHDVVKTPKSAIKTLCNSRLLRSHMRLKKNRPYNIWLKSQGHYLLCFSTSKTVGANSVHFRHETRTRYSLKATNKIPPTLENKNVPILRSQNTQNTRMPLKTGSEQSVKLLFIGQWNFDPFQMDQPKTRLITKYTREN